MIIASTEYIAGYEIVDTIDIARGSTVRARSVGRDIGAAFKNLVGGEVAQYTNLMAHAREEAIDRMVADAERMGAHAIINVRFTTSAVMAGASEILAYGTAVRIRKK
jgi:uncharacterized protein YbjQ (UPF0145 family)